MDDLAVLIPHFNNYTGLMRTLDSIANDNSTKVNVFVIDDGSQEFDKERLEDHYGSLLHLTIRSLNRNQGVAQALNLGLELIRNRSFAYIARIDSGDEMMHNRLKKQKQFLTDNPGISLVGSWVDFFDTESNRSVFTYKVPESHKEIKKAMNFQNCFGGSAVTFRTEILDEIGPYPTEYFTEDYAYFYQIVNNFETANIPEVLTRCELNPRGITIKQRKAQFKSKIHVISDFSKDPLLKRLGIIKNYLVGLFPHSVIKRLKKTFWL